MLDYVGTPLIKSEDRGKAALTQHFEEVKTNSTPIIVEKVVSNADETVRLVRFPGLQSTQAGERKVKRLFEKLCSITSYILNKNFLKKHFNILKNITDFL